MSLTLMLKDRTMRNLFHALFEFQPYRVDAKMVAVPPSNENRPAIGTAFDYLVRFWLERRHPGAERGPWIAENGVLILEESAASDPRYAGLARAARESLTYAKSEHRAYVRTGDPTDGLMRAALELAELDVVYRARVTVGVGKKAREEDISDLRALWAVMEDGGLKGLRAPLSLNPEFGNASDLVGGADADIVADGDLIEIKTVKSPSFKRRYFDQLVGYALLRRLAGGPDFGRIGVYFSRHGRLEWMDAACIYGERFDAFLPAFHLRAEEMFGRGNATVSD